MDNHKFKQFRFKAPNPSETIMHIRSYAYNLVETGSDNIQEFPSFKTIGSAIYQHKYQLSSYNWLYNDNIIDKFNHEFHKVFQPKTTWDYYVILRHVLYYWLNKYTSLWVLDYNPFQTVDLYSTWDQWVCIETIQDIEEKEIQVKNDDLEKFFKEYQFDFNVVFQKTIRALQEALICNKDQKLMEWWDNENRNRDDIKIPVALILDPFFLTMTFIH